MANFKPVAFLLVAILVTSTKGFYMKNKNYIYSMKRQKCTVSHLTLQEGAYGMDIKKGGALNARPYKKPFKGPFGPIFFA